MLIYTSILFKNKTVLLINIAVYTFASTKTNKGNVKQPL